MSTFLNEEKNWVWYVFHACYTFIYVLLFILFTIKGNNWAWNYITFYNRIFITSYLIALYFPAARVFFFRYLTIPLFGLAWTVFIFRIVFIIITGPDWFYHFNIIKYGNPDLQLHRVFDLALHFIPLLIMYQTTYIYKQEIREQLQQINAQLKALLIYSPIIFIFGWCMFIDPFSNYVLPKIPYGLFAMFICIFITLNVTGMFYHMILTKPDREPVYIRKFETVILVIIIINTVIGILLFGFSNLYKSILQWLSLSVLLLIVLRKIPGLNIKAMAWLFIPTYGFNIAIAFMREMVFIKTGGSHYSFVSLAAGSILPAYQIWYAVYIFIHYTCVLQTLGYYIISELPWDPSAPSPIRETIIKYKYRLGRFTWTYRFIQAYGGLIVVFLFLLVNQGSGRYKIIGPQYASLLYVLSYTFFCFTFSHAFYYDQVTFYERQIKKRRPHQSPDGSPG
jgi:hypothetical protein